MSSGKRRWLRIWAWVWYNEIMSKTAKKTRGKAAKDNKRGSMGVYSSLMSKEAKQKVRAATKKSKAAKSDPEANLRPLPKEPVKRFFAHFRWERIKAYWFSKAGLKRIGKVVAACFLLGIIGVGALFVYYKSQLQDIQLSNLTISETVNTYLDRNGVVLWEDKGDADYRLVVEAEDISPYAYQATVAIEDKNFYNHPGVDIGALIRAVFATLSGQGVQGGSTLTQQLIKQVYFMEEATSENRGGIARKLKELILAIELEKMYSKEQIITMYLNESPYGGRRNGIESAAQTYFGKTAKDLTLAEAALLAAIPNNPTIYNPYNTAGNEMLIERQHKVLDSMVEMGYITAEEAQEAKDVAILDQILPESNQYSNMKAPHFVMEVKKQLEAKYGIQAMREGGYTITTSLDYRAQEYAEQAVATGAEQRYVNGSDNIALVSVDVDTSQVIAMVGSVDWNTPVYGEVNATTSLLEPGSSIKPILDYAALFSLTGDTVYGPGSILRDENIDSMYCAGYTGACSLRNSTGRFYGNVTIRQSLGNSFNIAAVKALAIVGIENGLETAHALGDLSYCADGGNAGLSMAIGSGCTVRMVEHANAFASISRGGTYKELSYVLEVKDRDGNVVEKWEDSEGERAIDEQVAYELSSIMSDANARNYTFGSQGRSFGFVVPGVWTASKTGTTTTANSAVTKDSWMASYSTAISTVVWNGNHDGSGLTSNTNQIVRRVVNDYMENVHKNVYAPEGLWAEGDQPTQPEGIQTLTVGGIRDIWPSWYNSGKNEGTTVEKVQFNKENKLRAAECTPENLRVEVEVTRIVDPISGSVIMHVPDGYNYDQYDPCTVKEAAIGINAQEADGVTQYLEITLTPGTYGLESYRIVVDGAAASSGAVTEAILSNGLVYTLKGTEKSVVVEVTDENGGTVTQEFTKFSWS